MLSFHHSIVGTQCSLVLAGAVALLGCRAASSAEDDGELTDSGVVADAQASPPGRGHVDGGGEKGSGQGSGTGNDGGGAPDTGVDGRGAGDTGPDQGGPATTAIKWNPGDYMSTLHYGTSVSDYTSDIDNLKAHGWNGGVNPTILGYVYEAYWWDLYNPGDTFDNSVADAQNATGSYAKFAQIGTAFNYLQTQCSGARMGILINALDFWFAKAPTGTLSNEGAPNFVLNAPGGQLTLPDSFGGSSTTPYTMTEQHGGQYGWGVTGWNGSKTAPSYAFLVPALWEPAVNQAWILFYQALSDYVLPAGSPCAGMTLDQCPLIEFIGNNDEMSADCGTGGDPWTPSGSGDSAPTFSNYFSKYSTWVNSAANAFPHTLFMTNFTFGFSFPDGYSTNTDMYSYMQSFANLSATTAPGVVFSSSDFLATAWAPRTNDKTQSSWSQQAFIGIQSPGASATAITEGGPGPDYRGVVATFAQIQNGDYANPSASDYQAVYVPDSMTGATSEVVSAISTAANFIQASHRLWCITDDDYSASAWSSYIYPGIQASPPVNKTRPSNLRQ
jgi:hypothetical protein